MRVDLEPCVILHRRAYRDTSLMLDVFSREHGRVALIARGARRPKARWRGILEPLRVLQLSWSGRGEMQTLTAAESQPQSTAPTGDRLYAAFYGAELVMRLTGREDPHPYLYDRVIELIDALCNEAPMAPELRRFERDLLAELGYGLLLDVETESGDPVVGDNNYFYHPEHGIRIADARPFAAELPVGGASLLALADGTLSTPTQLNEARRVLAAALQPHLGGKPLRSSQTLRAMRRLKQSGAQQQ